MSVDSTLKRDSNALKCLPNCFVIGPQRAGTTWIYEYLYSRADVAVSQRVKEIYFFDRNYSRGLPWYNWHFAAGLGRKWIIDVAPTYFNEPEVPGRILSDIGPVPIVCTLRHPARRAFSLYLLYRRYGLTRQSFQQAAAEIPHIMDSSRYATNLARWIDVFGKDNVRVLFLETLAKSPNQYAEQLCSSLGIPFVEVQGNLSASPNPMDGMPFSSLVVRSGFVIGNCARSLRLYGLIEIAKKLGFKKVFFGAPGSGTVPKMTRDEFDWFMQQIGHEIEGVEELLGIHLDSWRKFDDAKRQNNTTSCESSN